MKQKVLLFGSPTCALCQGWKKKLEHLKVPYLYYDVETPEGLAELAYQNLARIPALVIGDQRWKEVNPGEITPEQLRKLTGLKKS